MSRARPTDKQRLVELLQARNEVVAVTGDGTNDAPALNHAHVGFVVRLRHFGSQRGKCYDFIRRLFQLNYIGCDVGKVALSQHSAFPFIFN